MSRERPDALPAMEDLEAGRVYYIRCRNLFVGVWNPETRGFIGIREKFGSKYLFTEFHYDADPHVGTVNAAEPMDIHIGDIPLTDWNNQELFDFLLPLDDEAAARRQREHEQRVLEMRSLEYKPKTEAEARYEEDKAEIDAWRKQQAGKMPWSEYREEYMRRFAEARRRRDA